MEHKLEWQSHPGTREFAKHLREERQQIMELWAGGVFTEESAEGTIQKNAKHIGKVEAIDLVLEYIEGPQEEVRNEDMQFQGTY